MISSIPRTVAAFDREEIQALVLGARMVRRFGDPVLARAADTILTKVAAVIPKALEPLLTETRLFVPPGLETPGSPDALGLVRGALGQRRKLRLHYADARGDATDRVVRPLGVFFWGRTWTLAAWCELRPDFRSFRLDRIRACVPLDDRYADEPGRSLRDLLTRYGPDAVGLLTARGSYSPLCWRSFATSPVQPV